MTHHLEQLHAESPDPWGVDRYWYEARKRALTSALLTRPHYARAFEPGCSIGALSAALAPRCVSLTCWDASPSAIHLAKQRLDEFPHVNVACERVPEAWPTGTFDLIVFSEIGYYLSEEALTETLRALRLSLGETGELIACHWRHPLSDATISGDAIHDRLHLQLDMPHLASLEDPDFRLDLWSRDDISPAQRDALR